MKFVRENKVFATQIQIGPYLQEQVEITSDGGPLFVEDDGNVIATLEPSA